MTDILTWGALITAAGSLIAFVSFWLNRGRAEAENAAKAAAAELAAAEGKRLAIEAHARVNALDAAFGLYRERIATEYVSRQVLREMEERIMTSIERLGERLDRVFESHGGKS